MFFSIFSPSVYWDNYSRKKKLFLQNYTRNIAKIDEIRKELWRNHQKRNFSFRNFLLRWYEQSIKNKELQDEEQKIYTNFFYFYILEELSRNIFHKFFKKEILKKITQNK